MSSWMALRSYLGNAWNLMDLLTLVLYFGGFIVRIWDPKTQAARVDAKTVHSVLAIVLWARLLRFYAMNDSLGPKLIMMTRMVKDVLAFVALVAVFLVGYGVATQGILFPLREFDYQSFENVVYRPYFQIYGELFLDDIQDESNCVGPWPFSSCGFTTAWLVPLLLALYVLVTNVLLINLLIAQFNQTYISVHEDSRRLWNKQNYGELDQASISCIFGRSLPQNMTLPSDLWCFLRFLYGVFVLLTIILLCLFSKSSTKSTPTNPCYLAR